jgi:dienelactone hydrolase
MGLSHEPFLSQVASHGFMMIASGTIARGSGQTTAKLMTDAVDWITASAGKGNYTNIDPSRVGAWGMSCGGLEAYEAGGPDARISNIGIFDSGLLNAASSKPTMASIKKPVFYFLGGPTDIAYENVSTSVFWPISPSPPLVKI